MTFRILILMSLVILTMKMTIPMLVINGNKILLTGPMLTSLLALMIMTMMMMMNDDNNDDDEDTDVNNNDISPKGLRLASLFAPLCQARDSSSPI